MNAIKELDPAELPPTVSPFIKQLISKLLDKNPKTRSDAASLL